MFFKEKYNVFSCDFKALQTAKNFIKAKFDTTTSNLISKTIFSSSWHFSGDSIMGYSYSAASSNNTFFLFRWIFKFFTTALFQVQPMEASHLPQLIFIAALSEQPFFWLYHCIVFCKILKYYELRTLERNNSICGGCSWTAGLFSFSGTSQRATIYRAY